MVKLYLSRSRDRSRPFCETSRIRSSSNCFAPPCIPLKRSPSALADNICCATSGISCFSLYIWLKPLIYSGDGSCSSCMIKSFVSKIFDEIPNTIGIIQDNFFLRLAVADFSLVAEFLQRCFATDTHHAHGFLA